ncbi:mCG1029240, isoform CRA_b [Mus musculus]|nr:mCG1029240, isoform CRA_b [Mus musculus]
MFLCWFGFCSVVVVVVVVVGYCSVVVVVVVVVVFPLRTKHGVFEWTIWSPEIRPSSRL